MTRCSRPMSWAEPRRLPSGGRRSAQACPAVSLTLKVRFERPPEIRSKLSGGSASGTFASNQPSTPARSIPSGPSAVAASLASAAMPPAYESRFRAVFFDFGGVLTTSVWDSFASFCRSEGLDPGTVKRLFRTDPEALRELRELETGAITEREFEKAFGRRLGLEDPDHLIDSMFAGMKPDTLMVGEVKDLRAAGLLTGLLSNSWSTSHYDRELLAELFDTAVISAEVHMHKPQPEIYRLAAERLNVATEECIFVDDLRENCEGAEAVGMTAVLHRNAPETIAKLAELTGIVRAR
jgi:putative hydrolase of the HAD superfamily